MVEVPLLGWKYCICVIFCWYDKRYFIKGRLRLTPYFGSSKPRFIKKMCFTLKKINIITLCLISLERGHFLKKISCNICSINSSYNNSYDSFHNSNHFPWLSYPTTLTSFLLYYDYPLGCGGKALLL